MNELTESEREELRVLNIEVSKLEDQERRLRKAASEAVKNRNAVQRRLKLLQGKRLPLMERAVGMWTERLKDLNALDDAPHAENWNQ